MVNVDMILLHSCKHDMVELQEAIHVAVADELRKFFFGLAFFI